MKYLAWYKRVGVFAQWHKIQNVIGDWTVDGFKLLQTDDDVVYQFPKDLFCFKFSADRARSIEKRMSNQAHQTVQVNRR